MAGLPEWLTDEEKDRVRELPYEFADSFSEDDYDVGRTDLQLHAIYTGDSKPVREMDRNVCGLQAYGKCRWSE